MKSVELKKITPRLLHGDLWSGNAFFDQQGHPIFVDPTVSYEDREQDIAMSQLFGDFRPEFLDAYQTIFPLEEGWEDRLSIYQLYYLLAHLNMLGESYGSQVDQLLESFQEEGVPLVKKYTKKYEVSYYECDINQTMTFPSVLGVVTKTSEDQSDQLGRGGGFVNNFGLTWVIMNHSMEINRLSRVGGVVSVTTQAMEYNKFFCYRNFQIHDEDGEELVKVESVFALMDSVNRKMSSVSEEIIAPLESEKIRKIKHQEKIEKIDSGFTLPYRIRFYDIDSNQHVNNAMRFNWIIDVSGYDFLTTRVPEKVIIRFDKGAEYGNKIESHFEQVPIENGIKTKHEIRMQEQPYCEANILWKNR